MRHGPRRADERGSGLILAIIVAVILLILCASYVLVATSHSRAGAVRVEEQVLQTIADGAIGFGVAEIERALLSGTTASSTLTGTVALGSGTGSRWGLALRRHAQSLRYWKLSAAARGRETYVLKEVIIDREVVPPPLPPTFRSSISTYFGFELIKNAEIDGNDHTDAGTAASPEGNTFAVAHKTGAVTFQGGSGRLAGNGAPLRHIVDANRVDPTYGGRPFPKTPLEVLEIDEYPPHAKVFDTLAEWDAYVASLPGGVVQGSEFLVLTFRTGSSTMFGGIDWSDGHHILIWHHPDPTVNSDPSAPKGVAGSTNMHIGSLNANQPFKGIAILDQWGHVNSGSYTRGGFVSLSGVPEQGLQGNTRIEWSTESARLALFEAGRRGVVDEDAPALMVSYREGIRDAEAFLALGLTGLSVTGSASTTPDWVEPYR